MSRLFARRSRDESGAVAILVALLTLVIMMFAAFAIDIGMQANRKHQLNDTLDAAAQAGAYRLPGSSVQARQDALTFAAAHDPSETGTLAPNIDFWCILASRLESGSYVVDTTQIPSTCNPGTAPYTVGANYKSTGQMIRCSAILCAIPCVEPLINSATPPIACNTIRVFQGRDVPFAFAPAGGIFKGGTGNLISVACKGSCGTVAPNPMDVAIVADRTLSMRSSDVSSMITGIKGMLQQMTPSQQYVTVGAIGRSHSTTTNQGASRDCNSSERGLTYGSTDGDEGRWMPIPFYDDYVDASGRLTSSKLVQGVSCLQNQSIGSQGTALAAPMKAAARYLLGLDPNNLSSLAPRANPPTKMIIFETDGQPNESQATGGTPSLGDPTDLFSNVNDKTGPVQTDEGDTVTVSPNGRTTTITHNKRETYTYNGGIEACNNLLKVAQKVKDEKILVVTIAYNMTGKTCMDYPGSPATPPGPRTLPGPEFDTSVPCGNSGNQTCTTQYQTTTRTTYVKPSGAQVLGVLAAAASPVEGVPSTADSACSTNAERLAENADGDYFFCAATGTDMAPIFRTALSQASKGVKLLRMP